MEGLFVEIGEGIEVVEGEGFARVVMPALAPTYWLRSPRLSQRVLSWFVTIFGIAMACGWCWIAVRGVIRMQQFFPVQNLIDAVLAIVCALGILLFGGAAAFLTAALVIDFFWKRIEVVISPVELVERYRRGPWVRQWRTKLEGIREISVRAPETVSSTESGKPTDQRQATVWFTLDTGVERRSFCVYTHRVATALASELLHRINIFPESTTNRTVALIKGAKVRAVDRLTPEFLNQDIEVAPPESTYVVTKKVAGVLVEMEHGFHPGILLQNPTFRAGLWHALLPLAFYLIVPALPLGIPKDFLHHALLLVVIFGSLGGLPLIAAIVWAQLSWESYEVTRGGLVRSLHGVVFRRRWHWAREDIAAVRLADRIGDKNRRRTVIELLMMDGTRRVLTSGNVMALRYLASLLRRELGVGSEAEVPRADPTDIRWNYEDETEVPAKLPFALLETADQLVVSKAWTKWSAGDVVAVAMACVFLLAAVVIPIVALPQVKDADGVRGVWVLTGWLGAFALLMTAAIAYEFSERWVLVVGGGELTFSRRTLFGSSARRCELGNIKAIRTAAKHPQNPATAVWLIVETESGEERVVGGKARAYRYLATVVRGKVGVPAEAGGTISRVRELDD